MLKKIINLKDGDIFETPNGIRFVCTTRKDRIYVREGYIEIQYTAENKVEYDVLRPEQVGYVIKKDKNNNMIAYSKEELKKLECNVIFNIWENK